MTNEQIKEQITLKEEQIKLLNREIDELRKKFDGDILEDVRAKYMGAVIKRSHTSFSKIFDIGFMMNHGKTCNCNMLTIHIPENYNPEKPGDGCMTMPTIYDDSDSISLRSLENNTATQADFDEALRILHDFHNRINNASIEKLCEMYPVKSDKE